MTLKLRMVTDLKTVVPQGVANLPMRATGPPGRGGITCQGPLPQGYERARRES
jgi:hypothetical protein